MTLLPSPRFCTGVMLMAEATSKLFANKIESVVVMTAQGIIEYVNHATVRTFGWQSEELVGQNVNVLMPERFASQHDQLLQQYQEKVWGAAQGQMQKCSIRRG